MPDEMFSGLFRDTADLRWYPVDSVRRRADQRRRRQRIAAGAAAAAVVAVVAAGTALAVGRGTGPDPTPPASQPPSPSVSAPVSPTSPSPAGSSPSGSGPSSAGTGSLGSAPKPITEIPASAMLQPVDGGPGWELPPDAEEVMGDWRLNFTFSICPAVRGGPGLPGVDSRERVIEPPGGSSEGRPGVTQAIDAAPSAEAAWTYVERVRNAVRLCADFQSDAQTRITMEVVASGFAGDRSLLVQTNGEDIQVIVQVGNLVAEVTADVDTVARGRQLGERAAARMCAVTGTC